MHRITRLTKPEILYFTFQMSVLLNQNYLLPDAIRLLKESTQIRKLKNWFKQLLETLEEGESFHESIRRTSKNFSSFYLSVLKSGEMSGSLGTHLKRLYEYLRSRNKFEAKMRKASFYPIFLICITISITIGLLTFILPMIQDLGVSLNITLPPSIQRLLAILHWLKMNAWMAGSALIALIALFYVLCKKNAFLIHGLILKLPILGEWFRKNDLSLFFRELSLLLKDQISIEDAIPVASESIHNTYLRQQIELASMQLHSGNTISETFRKLPGKDAFLLSMLRSGEESNQLSENLDFVIQVLEQELEQKQDRFVNSIEPVMLLVIGGIVLLLVVNLYFPIFQMINSMDFINTI